MLYGKGYDRWFDKSFTLVFGKNGRVSDWSVDTCGLDELLIDHFLFSLDADWIQCGAFVVSSATFRTNSDTLGLMGGIR